MHAVRDIIENGRNWELMRTRQSRETFRNVYRVDNTYVVKKFEIPATAVSYRKPWETEINALNAVFDNGSNPAIGVHEEVDDDYRTVWFVKHYINGNIFAEFKDEDIPDVAKLLASLHKKLIITDDTNVGNFLKLEDGSIIFLDLGRAILHKKKTFRYYQDLGSELAKIAREGFNWNPVHRKIFRETYFDIMQYPKHEKALVLFSCRSTMILRFIRKALQSCTFPWCQPSRVFTSLRN